MLADTRRAEIAPGTSPSTRTGPRVVRNGVPSLDMSKVNPNGGAVALGHPIGCSGAFLATKAIYELHRTGGRYALVTMCICGGQGIAAIFERL